MSALTLRCESVNEFWIDGYERFFHGWLHLGIKWLFELAVNFIRASC
jgi:hypothetical protein